jgi:hypothetical protein
MKKVLFLVLGISAMLASVCFTGCSTSPKGTEGKISLSDTLAIGTKNMVTVTLKDADLTGTSEAVKVTSTADPVGVTLNLTGKNGVYSGTLAFSTITSVGDTIKVSNNALVTFTYKDALPVGTRTETLIWQGSDVVVSMDSSAYNGFENMNITLTDDHTAAASLVVRVSSQKVGDTVSVTLTPSAGNPSTFNGSIGFATAKTATSIGVLDSDVVTVSFYDDVMSQAKSATANWYSTILPGLGVFSVEVTPGSTINPAVMPLLFNWTNTCTFDATDSMGINGKTPALNVVVGSAGWAGFGWCNTAAGAAAGIDLSAYAACTLHVALKGDATDMNLLVENNNPNGNTIPQTWVDAATFGYAPDSAWHVLNIPLSAWSATCDFTNLTYFLGVSFVPYTAGQWVTVDDVYWTLPATGASSKRRVVLKAK